MTNLFSQNPPLLHYSLEDGLTSNYCYRVIQDSKGYIWTCTDKGVSKFDGYTFKNYSSKDGLPFIDINYLFEDNQRRLWLCGYTSHFCYIDLETDSIISFPNPYPTIQTYNGYFTQFNDTTLISSILENSYYYEIYPNSKSVKKINLPQTGLKSCHKDINLNSFNGIHLTAPYFQNTPDNKQIISQLDHSIVGKNMQVGIDPKGMIHVFTSTKHRYKNIAELNDKSSLEKIFLFGNQYIFLHFSNKSIVIDTNFVEQKQFDFINEYEIQTMYLDKEENLWLTSKMNGVYFISQKALQSKKYELPDLQKNALIHCITTDGANKLFLGTTNGKIYNFSLNANITPFFHLKTKGFFRKLLFHKHSQKLIFITNESKFPKGFLDISSNPKENNIIETKQGSFFEDIYLLPNKFYSLIAAYKDLKINQDKLLLTSSYSIEREDGIVIPSLKRLSSSVLDNEGKVWCGGPDGLYVYQDSTWNELNELKNKFPIVQKPINDIFADSSSIIWVATESQGIYVIYKNQVIVCEPLKNLSLNNMQHLNGKLYCNTHNQIFSLSFDTIAQSIKSESVFQSGSELQSTISSFTILDNRLCVASNNFLYVSPINMTPTYQKTNPIFVSFMRLGNKYFHKNCSQIIGNHDENYFQLNFSSLTFSNLKTISYEYFIAGLDDEWRACNGNSISIFNLPPGHYTLSIRGKDAANNSYELSSPIQITIKPFWLFSWWSKTLGICLLIGLLTYLYVSRTKKLKDKADLEIELNRKVANFRLDAIRNQMNPHFVFNCLNSIQTLILKNNVDDANHYLNKFSKLMRQILDSSYSKFTTLKEEIKFLNLYLELEKLRFGDTFKFSIQVDPELDLLTEIPSMLIQPYVENSIHHGVSKLDKNGEVTIAFKNDNGNLIVEIDDNGIGRAASFANKKLTPPMDTSRGTQITNDKVQIINQYYNLNISIEILDKMSALQKAIGTKVMIMIKIHEDEKN